MCHQPVHINHQADRQSFRGKPFGASSPMLRSGPAHSPYRLFRLFGPSRSFAAPGNRAFRTTAMKSYPIEGESGDDNQKNYSNNPWNDSPATSTTLVEKTRFEDRAAQHTIFGGA
jgi:hypothetical protein